MNISEQAIQAAGGLEAVRQELNLSRQAILKWIRNNTIPPTRIHSVWIMGGRAISLTDLNPIVYPADILAPEFQKSSYDQKEVPETR